MAEHGNRIDFAAVNAAALRALPHLLARWAPDGHQRGREWVARNPTRPDAHPGSFSVNMRTPPETGAAILSLLRPTCMDFLKSRQRAG
jgi:hypothetical protein